jgi:hypothetical protein
LLGVDVAATLAALLHLGNEVAEELREQPQIMPLLISPSLFCLEW